VDDLNTTFAHGGKAYSTYGIDPCTGAIVVVRPDGYVGIVASLENVSDIDAYFSEFMIPQI
jgi:phenol 2-monooxygenase